MGVKDFEGGQFGKTLCQIVLSSPFVSNCPKITHLADLSIEVLVCHGSPFLLRTGLAFLWWIFTQGGIKEDLIVSVQCPFGHLEVSVTA